MLLLLWYWVVYYLSLETNFSVSILLPVPLLPLSSAVCCKAPSVLQLRPLVSLLLA